MNSLCICILFIRYNNTKQAY